jgi:glycosyl transferase, family 25
MIYDPAMLTYCINLKSSPDRRTFMQQQFDALQLNVNWINAINGRQLPSDQLEALCDRKKQLIHSGKRLSAGEIGCALSHQIAYQKLLDSSEHACMILEDDIDLAQAQLNVLEQCFNSTIMQQEKPCMILLFPIKQFYNQGIIKLNNGSHQLVRSFRGLGAHSYIINRAGAKFLLALNKKIQHVADPWNLIQLFYPNAFNFYAIQQPIMPPHNTFHANSDIDRVDTRHKKQKRSIYHLAYGLLRGWLLLNEWRYRIFKKVTKIPKQQRQCYGRDNTTA